MRNSRQMSLLMESWKNFLKEENSTNFNTKISEILVRFEKAFPNYMIEKVQGNYGEVSFLVYDEYTEGRNNYPIGTIECIKDPWFDSDDYIVFSISSSDAEGIMSDKRCGPLLYELILEYVSSVDPKAYLLSDREIVSKPAKKVWDYYLKSRSGESGDVISQQFDVSEENVEYFGEKDKKISNLSKNRDIEDDEWDEITDYKEDYGNNILNISHLTPNDPNDDVHQVSAIKDKKSDWSESSLSKGYRKKDGSTPLTDYFKGKGRLK